MLAQTNLQAKWLVHLFSHGLPVLQITNHTMEMHLVPVCRSGNMLDSINVVTLRWAWLVPGWVTLFGQVYHLSTEPGTQVDSSLPV